jgi:hypothetical protein
MFRVAWVFIAIGILLVLANWYAKPEDALRWIALLAMFAIMTAMLRLSPVVARRLMMEATAPRSLDQVATGVVFAALIIACALALKLARLYGVVDDSDLARRSIGALMGVYLAMVGNVMPKNLPPLSSMRCDGARQQAFQRLVGWTWVLCGLGSAIAWLALSIDSAEIATTVLVVTAMAVTIVQLLRLRRPRKDEPAHGLN